MPDDLDLSNLAILSTLERDRRLQIRRAILRALLLAYPAPSHGLTEPLIAAVTDQLVGSHEDLKSELRFLSATRLITTPYNHPLYMLTPLGYSVALGDASNKVLGPASEDGREALRTATPEPLPRTDEAGALKPSSPSGSHR